MRTSGKFSKQNLEIDEDPDSKEKDDALKGGECVVCLDVESNAVFVPCGHICMCMECIDTNKTKECPICRKAITQVVKIFKC